MKEITVVFGEGKPGPLYPEVGRQLYGQYLVTYRYRSNDLYDLERSKRPPPIFRLFLLSVVRVFRKWSRYARQPSLQRRYLDQ